MELFQDKQALNPLLYFGVLIVMGLILLVTGRGWVWVRRRLITNDNLDLIARNWRKLVESGMFKEEPRDFTSNDRFLTLSGNVDSFFKERDPFYTLQIRIYPQPREEKKFARARIIRAVFERDSLEDSMPLVYNKRPDIIDNIVGWINRMSNCRVNIVAANAQCEVELFARVRRPSGKRFEEILAEIIRIAGEY